MKDEGSTIDIKDNNLGKLFYNFLVFYGNEFNPKETIIDPDGIYDNDEFFDRSNFTQNSDLIIIDPLNPMNNVAKNTRQFNNIKLAFMISSISAKEECECGCHFESEHSKMTDEIEHCLLKRIFNSVKRFSNDNNYS